MLQEEGYEIAETMIISDEPDILKRELIRLADQCCVDLIITSGGTGFAMRDRTPEITMEVADRNAPGIAEYIRTIGMYKTKSKNIIKSFFHGLTAMPAVP